MSPVIMEIEMPAELSSFQLPEGVHRRLQTLLDRQDQGQALTPDEQREAEGLVDMAEWLSLVRCAMRRPLRRAGGPQDSKNRRNYSGLRDACNFGRSFFVKASMLPREQFQSLYEQGPEAVYELFTALSARVADLEARRDKDSHNSNKPPSSDGLAKKPVSLRPQTGRKPGGQKGHAGRTLPFAETPDHVETYTPTHCTGCQADLACVPGIQTERRQVRELPPVRLHVTEHRAQCKVCRRCGHVTTAAFPAEVQPGVQYGGGVQALAVYLLTAQLLPIARVAGLLADLCGQAVSPGTLTRWQQQAAERLSAVTDTIHAGLQAANVAHFDETGLRVAGRLHWLHVASTKTLTAYAVSPRRGQDGMEQAGVLPAFTGTACHDGWASYQAYSCRHALCNAHHLRELTGVYEQTKQAWAQELLTFLLATKQTVQEAREQGHTRLPLLAECQIEARYRTLLVAGDKANPPPVAVVGRRGKPKQSAARNLLDRLRRFARETLAFVYDFAVPFDNNQAERDVRMVKVQQKVSGCFRTLPGAVAFCRVRGYLSTLRKQGHLLLPALRYVFAGQPLCPTI